MKTSVIKRGMLIAAPLLAIATTGSPLAAQMAPGPRAGERQLRLDPPGDFVVGHSQRAGNSQIVEWVPRGQSVRRYTKMITLTSFVARASVSPNMVLLDFTRRYIAACRGTRATTINLGGGNSGVRLDCPRNAASGRPETVFARTIPIGPAIATLQYMTAYTTPPGEAAFAREFIGKAGVR